MNWLKKIKDLVLFVHQDQQGIAPFVLPAVMGGLGMIGGGKSGKKPKTQNQRTESQLTPWGPAAGDVGNILDANRWLFQNYAPQYPDMRRPRTGPSQQSRGLLDDLIGLATGGTPLMGAASQFIQGNLGGPMADNPFLQQTFDAASQYRPQYADAFIQNILGPGGGMLNNPYLTQFIEHGMGQLTGGGRGGGRGGFGGYTMAQAPGVTPVDTSDLNEAIRREMLENYERSIVPQIDAEYQRAGRYGSNAYAAAQAMANEEIMEAIGAQQADTMLKAQIAAMQASGQQNAARTAAASSAAQQQAALQSAQEGRLLDAILGLSGVQQAGAGLGLQGIGLLDQANQFGLGMMGDMSGLFQRGIEGDQQYNLGLLGMIPGLEGITTDRLLGGLGASTTFDQMRNQGNLMNWENQFNRQMWESQLPYTMLDQYAKYALPLAETFGQHRGMNVQTTPPTGKLSGALQGGMGGAMAGLGMGNLFGGAGGGGLIPSSLGPPPGGTLPIPGLGLNSSGFFV
jgi:hypothetical protein